MVSDGEFHEADVVVLAAALGIPELVKPLGVSVPLTAKPRTVTVITKPMKRLLQHIVVTGRHSMPLHACKIEDLRQKKIEKAHKQALHF